MKNFIYKRNKFYGKNVEKGIHVVNFVGTLHVNYMIRYHEYPNSRSQMHKFIYRSHTCPHLLSCLALVPCEVLWRAQIFWLIRVLIRSKSEMSCAFAKMALVMFTWILGWHGSYMFLLLYVCISSGWHKSMNCVIALPKTVNDEGRCWSQDVTIIQQTLYQSS